VVCVDKMIAATDFNTLTGSLSAKVFDQFVIPTTTPTGMNPCSECSCVGQCITIVVTMLSCVSNTGGHT